ncbi:hypothetical protein ATANTOWER_012009 [Ataeniobius toweri]|uniref:Uncharacterized protein n=1 Tax=Ataeniobius toweri TaxID=208326 RepID=A0ABU7BF77_9TELE|nr:hypothetical protein [Ataeniobius toweri]
MVLMQRPKKLVIMIIFQPGSVSRPSSGSFGELTRPRLPRQDFKFGSQVKFQLAATELLTSSFHRANPVHPPASGTSGIRPKEEAPDLSSDSRKKDLQNLRNPGSLKAYQTRNIIPPDGPSTTANCTITKHNKSFLLKSTTYLFASPCSREVPVPVHTPSDPVAK